MAFNRKNANEFFRPILVLLAFLTVASANIDCGGKVFHCVNSTHFMICVDLGGGLTSTMDDFIIPCPPSTVCQKTNIYECELISMSSNAPMVDTSAPSVLGTSDIATFWEENTLSTTPSEVTSEVSLTETNSVSISTFSTESVTSQDVSTRINDNESAATVTEISPTVEYITSENALNRVKITEPTALVSTDVNDFGNDTSYQIGDTTTTNIIEVAADSTSKKYSITTNNVNVDITVISNGDLNKEPETEIPAATMNTSIIQETSIIENNVTLNESSATQTGVTNDFNIESTTDYIVNVTEVNELQPQVIDTSLHIANKVTDKVVDIIATDPPFAYPTNNNVNITEMNEISISDVNISNITNYTSTNYGIPIEGTTYDTTEANASTKENSLTTTEIVLERSSSFFENEMLNTTSDIIKTPLFPITTIPPKNISTTTDGPLSTEPITDSIITAKATELNYEIQTLSSHFDTLFESTTVSYTENVSFGANVPLTSGEANLNPNYDITMPALETSTTQVPSEDNLISTTSNLDFTEVAQTSNVNRVSITTIDSVSFNAVTSNPDFTNQSTLSSLETVTDQSALSIDTTTNVDDNISSNLVVNDKKYEITTDGPLFTDVPQIRRSSSELVTTLQTELGTNGIQTTISYDKTVTKYAVQDISINVDNNTISSSPVVTDKNDGISTDGSLITNVTQITGSSTESVPSGAVKLGTDQIQTTISYDETVTKYTVQDTSINFDNTISSSLVVTDKIYHISTDDPLLSDATQITGPSTVTSSPSELGPEAIQTTISYDESGQATVEDTSINVNNSTSPNFVVTEKKYKITTDRPLFTDVTQITEPSSDSVTVSQAVVGSNGIQTTIFDDETVTLDTVSSTVDTQVLPEINDKINTGNIVDSTSIKSIDSIIFDPTTPKPSYDKLATSNFELVTKGGIKKNIGESGYKLDTTISSFDIVTREPYLFNVQEVAIGSSAGMTTNQVTTETYVEIPTLTPSTETVTQGVLLPKAKPASDQLQLTETLNKTVTEINSKVEASSSSIGTITSKESDQVITTQSNQPSGLNNEIASTILEYVTEAQTVSQIEKKSTHTLNPRRQIIVEVTGKTETTPSLLDTTGFKMSGVTEAVNHSINDMTAGHTASGAYLDTQALTSVVKTVTPTSFSPQVSQASIQVSTEAVLETDQQIGTATLQSTSQIIPVSTSLKPMVGESVFVDNQFTQISNHEIITTLSNIETVTNAISVRQIERPSSDIETTRQAFTESYNGMSETTIVLGKAPLSNIEKVSISSNTQTTTDGSASSDSQGTSVTKKSISNYQSSPTILNINTNNEGTPFSIAGKSSISGSAVTVKPSPLETTVAQSNDNMTLHSVNINFTQSGSLSKQVLNSHNTTSIPFETKTTFTETTQNKSQVSDVRESNFTEIKHGQIFTAIPSETYKSDNIEIERAIDIRLINNVSKQVKADLSTTYSNSVDYNDTSKLIIALQRNNSNKIVSVSPKIIYKSDLEQGNKTSEPIPYSSKPLVFIRNNNTVISSGMPQRTTNTTNGLNYNPFTQINNSMIRNINNSSGWTLKSPAKVNSSGSSRMVTPHPEEKIVIGTVSLKNNVADAHIIAGVSNHITPKIDTKSSNINVGQFEISSQQTLTTLNEQQILPSTESSKVNSETTSKILLVEKTVSQRNFDNTTPVKLKLGDSKDEIAPKAISGYSTKPQGDSEDRIDTETQHTVTSSLKTRTREEITTTAPRASIATPRETTTKTLHPVLNITPKQHVFPNTHIDSSKPITNYPETRYEVQNPLLSFCHNRNRGRYPDPEDCTKFYICIGRNEPIVGRCPENTVFSDFKKQCTKNKSHCVRNNEFKCITNGRFSDVLKQKVYYICVKRNNIFIRFQFQCQNGYYLNQATVKCMKEEIVQQSSDKDKESKSEPSSSEVQNSKEPKHSKKTKQSKESQKEEKKSNKDFECEHEGKFVDPKNCKKYYLCTKNKKSEFRKRRKSCDSDEVFHKDKKKCVDSDSYDEC